MARNGMALSGLWALGVLGCAQVTVDDPPSQLGSAAGIAGASGTSPNTPSVPGSLTPGAPPPMQTPTNGQQQPGGGAAGTRRR